MFTFLRASSELFIALMSAHPVEEVVVAVVAALVVVVELVVVDGELLQPTSTQSNVAMERRAHQGIRAERTSM